MSLLLLVLSLRVEGIALSSVLCMLWSEGGGGVWLKVCSSPSGWKFKEKIIQNLSSLSVI